MRALILAIALTFGSFPLACSRRSGVDRVPCLPNADLKRVADIASQSGEVGTGTVPEFVEAGTGVVTVRLWQLNDGAEARVTEVSFARWGLAHEALGRLLSNAHDVCQFGRDFTDRPPDDGGTTVTRVTATVNSASGVTRALVVSCVEYDTSEGSRLTVIDAGDIEHALAMEIAFYSFDY